MPVLRVLTDKFINEGFEIIQAQNGVEGLEKALKDHPDLILLDIIMPKMDGITLFKKLREDEWGKTAGVIILTNLSGDGQVSELLKSGVYEYLIKTDWTLDELAAKVKNRIGSP